MEMIIKCANPDCMCDNLHHSTILCFNRKEDGETYKTLIGDHKKDNEIIDRVFNTNPSSRRHGLNILCWCERCSYITIIHISQHKGTTYLETAAYHSL